MNKNIVFNLICILHVLIWVFVFFAFMNIKTAKINLYYIIPLIYVLHMLPFHILIEQKKKIYKNQYKIKEDIFFKKSHVINIINLQQYLDKKCLFNPISPQGMMIFGALSSSYVLLNNINLINFIKIN